MQKALIWGNNEKIANNICLNIKWKNAGYETADIAISKSKALSLIRQTEYGVLIMLCDNFSWEEFYNTAKTHLRKTKLILLCQSPDLTIAKKAIEYSAAGLFNTSDTASDSFFNLLREISANHQSGLLLSRLLTDEKAADEIYFQLNGNSVAYFEKLFESFFKADTDNAIIRAACSKLICIIYDYLEGQGFKSAKAQRQSAIHKLNKIPCVADVIEYTKNRYINFFQFETEKSRNYHSVLTENIKEYILNSYTEEALGVPKIAEKFHFSSNYINGIFKSQTGETIPSFITNLKLGKAKRLLTETKMPISEIAIEVGYSRLTYFSRIFKKKYNISPLEYRNKFSENK